MLDNNPVDYDLITELAKAVREQLHGTGEGWDELDYPMQRTYRDVAERLYLEGRNAALKDLSDLESLVKTQEQKIAGHNRQGSVYHRVRNIVEYYERSRNNQIGGAKAFRDDVLITLRALALCAENVAGAGTHHEKNIRLRGLVEILEGGIGRLQKAQLESDYRWYDLPSVFRSDYPTRELLQKIHQLEGRISELTDGKEKPQSFDMPLDSPF